MNRVVNKKNTKGFTIIELVVAMAIFVVVITLSVGGFISLLRLQSQTETMTNVQQNGRIAVEQITRLARQAEVLEISDNALLDTLKIKQGTTETCYKVDSEKLKKYEDYNCAVGTGLTLTSSDVKVTSFDFTKNAGMPPSLTVILKVEAVNISGRVSEDDNIELKTNVLLTGLR